jgi:mxaJ protein
MVQGDYALERPQDAILDAVAERRIDLAYVWGPLAGDYARRHPGLLDVGPISPAFDGPRLPMMFDVSVGFRKEDTDLRRRVNTILQRRRPEIDIVLRQFGVIRGAAL